MEKPFVVCHMFTSMDGKIDGAFMGSPAAVPARTEYGRLREFYKCQATLYGTVTMYGGFANGLLREVPVSDTEYPLEDWTAPHTEDSFIVAADPKGTLAWSKSYIQRPGRPRSHVIEALTEQVSLDYLGYLRKNGISYVFAGETWLDCPLLLHKLKTRFGIERLMVSGGGYMNGSLLQEDLIDEVSIVVAPVADGNTTAVSIFERSDFLPRRDPAEFSLLDAKKLESNGLWLRYALKK